MSRANFGSCLAFFVTPVDKLSSTFLAVGFDIVCWPNYARTLFDEFAANFAGQILLNFFWSVQSLGDAKYAKKIIF